MPDLEIQKKMNSQLYLETIVHSCFTDEPDVNVVLTIHDELVTVAREDLAEETAEAIRVSMEGIYLPEMTVPLIADVKIVNKWGEAK